MGNVALALLLLKLYDVFHAHLVLLKSLEVSQGVPLLEAAELLVLFTMPEQVLVQSGYDLQLLVQLPHALSRQHCHLALLLNLLVQTLYFPGVFVDDLELFFPD